MTFTEIVKSLQTGSPAPQEIAGIAFMSEGKVFMTAQRDLIEDLDVIPFPARDLFELDRYYQAATKRVSPYKSTSIITSRGCPFDCTHCISKLIWKRRVRYRSIKSIIDEIETCVNSYGIREFNLYDDTFTLNKKRVLEFCEEIKRRDLNIAWICFGRVDIIDYEMLSEMKQAGCRKISFGLESGSQEILDAMRKGTTPEMGRKAVEAADRAGLAVHASFMIGNIGETEKTVRISIDYAKSLKLDNATFFITVPFPGTDLYRTALEKGYIDKSSGWEKFAPITKSAPVLIQDSLSQEDLIRWQKRAFNEFYLRPSYILRKLRRIRSFSDIKMMFEGLGVFFRVQKK